MHTLQINYWFSCCVLNEFHSLFWPLRPTFAPRKKTNCWSFCKYMGNSKSLFSYDGWLCKVVALVWLGWPPFGYVLSPKYMVGTKRQTNDHVYEKVALLEVYEDESSMNNTSTKGEHWAPKSRVIIDYLEIGWTRVNPNFKHCTLSRGIELCGHEWYECCS